MKGRILFKESCNNRATIATLHCNLSKTFILQKHTGEKCFMYSTQFTTHHLLNSNDTLICKYSVAYLAHSCQLFLELVELSGITSVS